MPSIEYAKSNRSACRTCCNKISKGELRIGVEEINISRGYVSTLWFHTSCFNFSIESASDFRGFSSLSSSDKSILNCKFGATSPNKVSKLDDTAAKTSAANFSPHSSSPNNTLVRKVTPSSASSTTSTSSSSSSITVLKRGGAVTINQTKSSKLTTSIAKSKKSKSSIGKTTVIEDFDKQPHEELGIACIEYARAKKPSACKHCKGAIRHGEVRIGEKERAWQFEGIMTRWLHLRCGLCHAGLQRLNQLQGWDRIGYDTSKEIRVKTKQLLENVAEEQLEQRMKSLEKVQDLLLENLSNEEMIECLSLNSINAYSQRICKNPIDMTCMLADGIVNGLAMNCPVCENPSLTECHGRISCLGYMNGMTKCVYKAKCEDIARFRFKMLPSKLHEDWFLDWRTEWALENSMAIKEDLNLSVAAMQDDNNGGGDEEEVEAIKYSKLKVADLKLLLKEKNLCIVGKKSELIERLLQKPKVRQNVTFCDGLTVKKIKKATHASSSSLQSPAKRAKVNDISLPVGFQESQTKPQVGSAILQVHEGYKQTGLNNYSKAKVLVDDDGVTVYNASFVEVNLKRGINRFYVVQLFELSSDGFELFCHWGKVGVPYYQEVGKWGSNYNVYPFHSKSEAIKKFKEWFLKKGGNYWEQRHNFVQRPEMYSLVELSRVTQITSKKAVGNSNSYEAQSGIAACSLTNEVASLVELLFDKNTILNSMKEVGVDIKEMPLGSLSCDRILKCVDILSDIRQHLEIEPSDQDAVWYARLEMFSTDYFQQIPSCNPCTIGSESELKKRDTQVNLLMDVAVAQGLLKKSQALKTSLSSSSSSSSSSSQDHPLEEHPLDVKYKSLGCQLINVDKSSSVFKKINTSLNNTAKPLVESSLSGFKSTPKVTEIFEMKRDGKETRFLKGKYAGIGNTKLLWHGTDIAAGAAIVSNGLRVMPGSGGRCGKGIYFANEASKSGYYVRKAPDGSCIMFLAEVILGEQFPLNKDGPRHGWNLRKAPKGYHSVYAQGRTGPAENGNVELQLFDSSQHGNGGRSAILATSKPVVRSDECHQQSSFANDEFVVYKESQINLKYIVRLEM